MVAWRATHRSALVHALCLSGSIVFRRSRCITCGARISSHALLRDMTSFAQSASVRRHILNQLLQGAEDLVNNRERVFCAELSGFVSICCHYHRCLQVVSCPCRLRGCKYWGGSV